MASLSSRFPAPFFQPFGHPSHDFTHLLAIVKRGANDYTGASLLTGLRLGASTSFRGSLVPGVCPSHLPEAHAALAVVRCLMSCSSRSGQAHFTWYLFFWAVLREALRVWPNNRWATSAAARPVSARGTCWALRRYQDPARLPAGLRRGLPAATNGMCHPHGMRCAEPRLTVCLAICVPNPSRQRRADPGHDKTLDCLVSKVSKKYAGKCHEFIPRKKMKSVPRDSSTWRQKHQFVSTPS